MWQQYIQGSHGRIQQYRYYNLELNADQSLKDGTAFFSIIMINLAL